LEKILVWIKDSLTTWGIKYKLSLAMTIMKIPPDKWQQRVAKQMIWNWTEENLKPEKIQIF
jgi:hypothetical protein